MVLDCIDSLSLHPYLLCIEAILLHSLNTCICLKLGNLCIELLSLENSIWSSTVCHLAMHDMQRSQPVYVLSAI